MGIVECFTPIAPKKMYPYQQQPFANLQQQQSYYSPNPFLFSLPVASDSSLHPPGTDPIGNSNPFSASASAYGAQSTNSQNWIVKQAEPIRYDLAVGSSLETSAASASLPSTWNATWSHQSFANDTTVQINPTIALLPESSHANVQSHPSSIQGQVLIGPVSKELEPKQHVVLSGGATVDSAKVCLVCNVVCNSQDAYNKHLAGKKHAAQVGLISNNGIGPYVAEFKRRGIGPWKKAAKKIKVAQSAWCEVCKINCNSRDVYITHLAGKKHLKNLEKLTNPKIDAGTGVIATNASQDTVRPLIGPQEKPGTNKPKKQKAPEMDIETKKQKVVEGGAAAGAVRLCTLCNVVCNSQTVFDSHLAGHKHAAMLKKAGSSIG